MIDTAIHLVGTKNRTNMSTSLALIAAKALPALSGSSISYNPEKNVYLTLGYTSAAGNTYYRAIRLSKRLAVYYHIGEGYARTFLNGITLFCWDGQKAKIIAQKFWGGCNWRSFSEQFAKEQSIIMLKDFLAVHIPEHTRSLSGSLLGYKTIP